MIRKLNARDFLDIAFIYVKSSTYSFVCTLCHDSRQAIHISPIEKRDLLTSSVNYLRHLGIVCLDLAEIGIVIVLRIAASEYHDGRTNDSGCHSESLTWHDVGNYWFVPESPNNIKDVDIPQDSIGNTN